MELMPALEIGWLNGWMPLGLLVLVEGLLLKVFPKEVAARLFDRSGWEKKQALFTVIGKLFSLVCLVLIVLTPLKAGSGLFIVGAVLSFPEATMMAINLILLAALLVLHIMQYKYTKIWEARVVKVRS